MDEKKKLDLIYRLTSGYTFINCGKEYIIDTPDAKLVNESLNIFKAAVKDNLFEDFIRKQDTDFILIKNKLWEFKDNSNLKELEKSLDNAKLELYNCFGLQTSQVQKVRQRIELIRTRLSEKLTIKHSLDKFTLDGYADYVTEMFLFSKIILNKQYKKIKVNPLKLENIILTYKRNLPDISALREIARTEPWRSYWHTNKQCFRRMGDDQRMLSLFTTMYQNVMEHSDKPTDAIIEDDDALDGWFIHMKEKAEAERKEDDKKAISHRHGDASEIFILAQDKQDIEDVNNMNDTRGRIVRKRIDQKLEQKGTVQHLDIPEFRLEALKNG